MRALMFLVIVAAIALGIYGGWRLRRRAIHAQRRAARHARREEEERIWNETMNKH